MYTERTSPTGFSDARYTWREMFRKQRTCSEVKYEPEVSVRISEALVHIRKDIEAWFNVTFLRTWDVWMLASCHNGDVNFNFVWRCVLGCMGMLATRSRSYWFYLSRGVKIELIINFYVRVEIEIESNRNKLEVKEIRKFILRRCTFLTLSNRLGRIFHTGWYRVSVNLIRSEIYYGKTFI